MEASLKNLIMQYYQITITSKNEKSLKNYLMFFYKSIKFYNLATKLFNKKKKKFFVTILKSPHVNKKAQEQFGYLIFSKQLLISFSNNYQLIFFLKKLEKNLFSDVTLKIKLQLNKNFQEKIKKNFFNPDNFKLNIFKKDIFLRNIAKTKQLFEIFDIYGEINRKKF